MKKFDSQKHFQDVQLKSYEVISTEKTFSHLYFLLSSVFYLQKYGKLFIFWLLNAKSIFVTFHLILYLCEYLIQQTGTFYSEYFSQCKHSKLRYIFSTGGLTISICTLTSFSSHRLRVYEGQGLNRRALPPSVLSK